MYFEYYSLPVVVPVPAYAPRRADKAEQKPHGRRIGLRDNNEEMSHTAKEIETECSHTRKMYSRDVKLEVAMPQRKRTGRCTDERTQTTCEACSYMCA